MTTWRSDGNVVEDPEGRTVAIAVNPAWAGRVAEALNTYERVVAAREKAGVNAPTGEQRRVIPADQVERASARHLALVPTQTCERTTWHDCALTGNWTRH